MCPNSMKRDININMRTTFNLQNAPAIARKMINLDDNFYVEQLQRKPSYRAFSRGAVPTSKTIIN